MIACCSVGGAARNERRGLYTVLYALYRQPEIDREAFVDHWMNVHRPIASRMPGLRGYEIWPVTECEDPAGEEIDGLAVLRFDSNEAFERTLASPEFAEASTDARKFIHHFTRYAVDVHHII